MFKSECERQGFYLGVIFTGGIGSTSGFVQLGLDVETIIGNGYPSFIFGGRNSAGQ